MNRPTLLLIILFAVLPSTQSFAEAGYEGERNAFDRFHGQGTYVNSRGKYSGAWVDGVKSGQGTFTAKNGDVYTGQWADNKRNGTGKEVYANGSSYQGQWRANKKQGGGTFIFKNGDKLTGKWTTDAFSGSGSYKFKKGLEYQGSIANNKPNGKGQCKEQGKSQPCEFKKGELVAQVLKPAPKPAPKVVKKPKPKPVPAKAIVKKAKPKPIQKPKPKVYFSDKEEFYYQHDWANAGMFKGVSSFWKTKEDDDYALVISSENADFVLALNVNDYNGPGKYKLDYYKARITRKNGGSYATSADVPGQLFITRDTGNLISGLFEFTVFLNGNSKADGRFIIKKGKFTVDRRK